MKKRILSILICVTLLLILYSCEETHDTEQSASSYETSVIEQSVIEQSTQTESSEYPESNIIKSEIDPDSSIDLSLISEINTPFDESKVHYFDQKMGFTRIPETPPGFHGSLTNFDDFTNAQPDDWFVVGITSYLYSYEQLQLIMGTVGAIEIPDHPFLKSYCDKYYERLENAETSEEKEAIKKEYFSKKFPEFDLDSDESEPLDYDFTYIAYMTKPMIEELKTALSKSYISYTFMPELSRHDIWHFE